MGRDPGNRSHSDSPLSALHPGSAGRSRLTDESSQIHRLSGQVTLLNSPNGVLGHDRPVQGGNSRFRQISAIDFVGVWLATSYAAISCEQQL